MSARHDNRHSPPGPGIFDKRPQAESNRLLYPKGEPPGRTEAERALSTGKGRRGQKKDARSCPEARPFVLFLLGLVVP